jgi:tetratricopeptide (TPR) repeat protein
MRTANGRRFAPTHYELVVLDRAARAFQASAEMRPNTGSAQHAFAACLFGMERYADALRSIEGSIIPKAADGDVRSRRTSVTPRTHRPPDRATGQTDTPGTADKGADLCLDFGSWCELMLANAREGYCGSLDPADPGDSGEALWAEARHCLDIGDHRAAHTLYRSAVSTAPGYPWPWIGLGSALLGLGRPAEGRVAYLRAICLPPFLWESVLGLGVSDLRLGRFRLGLQAVCATPDRHPLWRRSRFGLLRALWRAGRFAHAVAGMSRSAAGEAALG